MLSILVTKGSLPFRLSLFVYPWQSRSVLAVSSQAKVVGSIVIQSTWVMILIK